MSRFLLVLLLALLPIQSSWAAAAGYCRHEVGSAVKHFGHHEHRHHGALAKTVGESAPDTKSKSAGGDDADCGVCHLGCAQPLVILAPALATSALLSTLLPRDPPWQASFFFSAIDRPNWTFAA